MTAPSLHLPDVPTAGPTGKRDNLERVRALLCAVMPAGGVLFVDIQHDDGCPCDAGRVSADSCTCRTVGVTLRLLDRRAS